MSTNGLKFIFWFNLTCLIVVVSAYIIEIVLGAFLQFFLGIIQIAIAFIINKDLKKSSQLNRKLFKIYKIITITYLTLFILNIMSIQISVFDSHKIFFCIPLIIASYQVFINYLVQK